MKTMNNLMRAPEVMSTMREMGAEMTKVRTRRCVMDGALGARNDCHGQLMRLHCRGAFVAAVSTPVDPIAHLNVNPFKLLTCRRASCLR